MLRFRQKGTNENKAKEGKVRTECSPEQDQLSGTSAGTAQQKTRKQLRRPCKGMEFDNGPASLLK